MRIAVIVALVSAASATPEFAVAQARVNPATVCVNGYRTTHVVRSGGRDYVGVLIRCRP